MHQGLMYLFELGVHNAPENTFGNSEGLSLPPESNSESNGYVTRTLRMLTNLLSVIEISTQMEVNPTENIVNLKFSGCR